MKHLVSCVFLDNLNSYIGDSTSSIYLFDKREDALTFKDILNNECERLNFSKEHFTFQSDLNLNPELIFFLEKIKIDDYTINEIERDINACKYFYFSYYEELNDNIPESIQHLIEITKKQNIIKDIIE